MKNPQPESGMCLLSFKHNLATIHLTWAVLSRISNRYSDSVSWIGCFRSSRALVPITAVWKVHSHLDQSVPDYT